MKPGSPTLTSTRLLDQLRERIRYLHYSLQTEKAYLYWTRFFIRWHGRGGVMRHPREMGAAELEAFLNMLANERRVSPSTQNQALSALLFLYREVLAVDLPWLDGLNRPAHKKRIPSVLTRDEVAALFSFLDGEMALLAKLLYGTGMRLMEGLRLRIKDVEFDRHVIVVRDGKGGKDRVVMLPRTLVPALRAQWLHARAVWDADARAGRGGVETPFALEKKEVPEGGPHLGLVLAVSVAHAVGRPSLGRGAPAPSVRGAPPARHQAGSRPGWHGEAGVRPHPAPLLRHASAAGGHRHPHGAGTAGTFGRVDHHDLHACAQGGGRRHPKPAGCAAAHFIF